MVTRFRTLVPGELGRLAIFPLPGAVLFPGSLLPLHVFEPRYVEMTKDVLAGSKLIAIANLAANVEADDHGRPAVFEIATVGEVVEAQPVPGGRFALLLRGLARIHIDTEHPPERAYRLVQASLLEDETTTSNRAALTLLISICDQLSMHIEAGGEELRELVRSSEQAGQLSDALASALISDASERQKLLETMDPAERVTQLIVHVSGLLAELGPRSDLPN